MTELRYFDLTSFPTDADAVCVTTNGIIRRDGRAVMGAGIALAFAKRWPEIAHALARKLHTYGNHVFDLGRYHSGERVCHVVSFPTKNHWCDDSDMTLIVRSAHELVVLADERGWKKVYLPQPGCACGRLSWANVRAVIEPVLDDRFVVTHR